MKNIFIEGIQGMGKSTLLQALIEKTSGYQVCHEGDYSPIELAWCTWMTENEYQAVWNRYPTLHKEIQDNTTKEGTHYIVSYTKILTDIPNFHKDLEQFEIYNGRKPLSEFEQIILSRYQKFCETGYIFECSFLQNIVECLILFYQLSDDEIIAFYQKLYGLMPKEHFLLLYLYSDNLEESTQIIRKERSDGQGNELWYPLMLEYLTQSPYGKQHNYKGFDDLIHHFRHRQQVELRILNEIIQNRAITLPAKQWDIEKILNIAATCP